MHHTASLPADHFDEVLRRLPADLDLDALALRTRAIERQRKIAEGASLLRLALARGPGGLSLSETAAWASMIGLAEMSDPAIKFRLDKAVEFLEAVVSAQLAVLSPGPVCAGRAASCAPPMAARSASAPAAGRIGGCMGCSTWVAAVSAIWK